MSNFSHKKKLTEFSVQAISVICSISLHCSWPFVQVGWGNEQMIFELQLVGENIFLVP